MSSQPFSSDTYEFYERYQHLEVAFQDEQRRQRRRRQRQDRARQRAAEERAALTDLNDHIAQFVPSYAAALDPQHHERRWLIDSVASFYRNGLITDVTRIVKGGKEANVYCCTANPTSGFELLAAKLYRPRMLRHLRNDALYKESRPVLDADGKELRSSGVQRAIRKKTRFGRHVDLMSWIGHEYEVQQQLYAAGADVPQPVGHSGNTIMMAYIGDEWAPAPALNEITLTPQEAGPLFDRIMANVALFLDHHYIHSDLSAYNILYWQGEPIIIDFPQLVDARKNRNAYNLLARDVRRVCQYFADFGVEADAAALTRELWEDYMGEPPLDRRPPLGMEAL